MCNKEHESHFCYSCQIGKRVKLPFYDTTSTNTSAFDIIHAVLWTSPICSSSGHKYYLVLEMIILVMCGLFLLTTTLVHIKPL